MLMCENLPRTNSTKYETQNILVKFQQNEHTPVIISRKIMSIFKKFHHVNFEKVEKFGHL